MDRPAALEAATPPLGRRCRRLLKNLFGYLVGAACLVWLFHDVGLEDLGRHIAGIQWGWVALAIAFDILGYVFQGWRWELLLRPVARLSPVRAAQAIYAGLFINEILPMRVGELVRAYLASRWTGADFFAVVPSMVVERFFDGVWLAVCIGLTTLFVPFPKSLLEAADILGVLILAATALFLYLVLRPRRLVRAGRPHARFRALFSSFRALQSGLEGIGRSRVLYVSLVVSLLMLASQILAFWLIMWACNLRLSFWAGAVVLLIVRLGTAIPNAPANLGTYQLFTVVGLGLFGVEKAAATSFSLVVFVLLTVPLWIIGLFAIARSGATLAVIRAEIGRLARRSP